MKPILVIALGGGVLALGALAVSSSAPSRAKLEPWQTVHGLPLGGVSLPQYEQTLAIWSTGPSGFPVANPTTIVPVALVKAWNDMQPGFRARFALLPKDALPTQDGYSTEQYWVAVPFHGNATRERVDQFGRRATGVPADPLGAALTAAGYALPFVPGIGPAAGAALAFTIALGKGKSLKESALAGARGALPPGPAQMAFDLGVGVVLEGKPPLKSAEDAFFKEYPWARQYYDKAKAMSHGLS